MPEPILTEEQAQRLFDALRTWGQIVQREHGKYPEWNYANITKSCLLGRLIYDGKEPLPEPPPTFMSAPWYSLIEEGRAYLLRDFAVRFHGDHVVIGQNDKWAVIDHGDDGTVTVEYPRNGRWVIRAVRDDERVEGGRMVNGKGGTDPIYCDTVLERLA